MVAEGGAEGICEHAVISVTDGIVTLVWQHTNYTHVWIEKGNRQVDRIGRDSGLVRPQWELKFRTRHLRGRQRLVQTIRTHLGIVQRRRLL